MHDLIRPARAAGIVAGLVLTLARVGAQTPAAAPKPDSASHTVPFAFADWSWLNGNTRTKDAVLDTKAFTGEFRLDATYIYHFARPADHTLVGTSESGRTGEIQVQQLGIGGDFHWEHVRGRLMTQFGMYSTMTPRNDASPARGQWNLDNAYRYLSEAYGGYHWDRGHGVNLDVGIFMSYVGLFSYYNFDNWAYQPSYVSSNTPWFFNGIRIQTFPTEKLKLEYWIVNGWQSYGMFNEAPGLGMQLAWRPNSNVAIISNNYYGEDWLGIPGRSRVHTDNSLQVKYHDDADATWSKGAFSLTVDLGCEQGGGVVCSGGPAGTPAQNFVGAMLYNRSWFEHDRHAVTLGAGFMTNPGRYLVLMPPINGATAFTGTPYFTYNPGDDFKAWDASLTYDYMPDQWTTFRFELNHREANVPYFAGPGGVTPPGGNNGSPTVTVPGWTPDLRKTETRMTVALLIKL